MKRFRILLVSSCALWASMAAGQKQTCYIPHFTFKDGIWSTEISINHTGDDLQPVTVTAFDADGVPQGEWTWEVGPMSGIYGNLQQLLSPLNAETGWLKITTSANPIQGLVKFSHLDHGGSTSLPAANTPSHDLVFSLMEHSSQWMSGFAVVNTADRDATVEIAAHRFDGALVEATTHVIPPHAKWVAMLDDVVQAELPAVGFLACHSSQPLVGLALTFSPNQDQIVAVPADLSAQAVTRQAARARNLAELTTGNNQLAIDLFHALEEESDNLFYSPHSIATALAMAFCGARHQTAYDMAETLHTSLAPATLHPTFLNLNDTLSQRGDGAAGRDGEGFRLHITQSLWGQLGYPFLPEFIDILETYYQAAAQWLDFAQDPNGSRVTINDWVAQQTEDRIQDLLPPDSIDALTRLVLVNTIYFNAAWAFPFAEEATQTAPFFLRDGDTIDVELMIGEITELPFVDTESVQAVALPYDGHELEMVVVAPKTGCESAFENTLSLSVVAEITGLMKPTEVIVQLPKFQFTSDSVSLKETLANLGMGNAFGGAADFSGIDGGLNLYISDVIHKAFVAVDEAGTEAAAATGVVFRETVAENPVIVRIDRPFVFWIQDLETRAILFFGRIRVPSW